MKKKLSMAIVCLLLVTMPMMALAEVMYVNTPNGGSVNLRSGPSADSDALTSVGYGEAVNLLDFLDGSAWANVSYNGYYGYIAWRYLSDYPPMPGPIPTYVPAPTYIPVPTYVPAPTTRPTSRPNPTAKPSGGGSSLENTLAQLFAGLVSTQYDATVVPSTPTTYVNLRWAPSKSAPVRAQYWAGSSLQVLSEGNGWSEVFDPLTNTHGFMMTSFLTPVNRVGGGSGSDS